MKPKGRKSAIVLLVPFVSSRIAASFAPTPRATLGPSARSASRKIMSLRVLNSKGSSSSVADDAAAYNAAISASVDITSAYLRNGIITLTRSARDVDSNSRRSFLYQIPLTGIGSNSATPTTQTTVVMPPPTELPTKIKARIPSPSGDKVAILVEEAIAKNGEDSKAEDTRAVFEIWTDGGHNLASRIVLPKDMHGKVCTDMTWFGGFSWSPDEMTLVYVAESKPPKTSSYFDRVDDSDGPNDDSTTTKATHIGGQFTLGVGKGEDWGEKYTGTSRLALFCINANTGNVGRITNVPGGTTEESTEGGYLLGQPGFSPDGRSIVYVGWDAGGGGSMPRRLGSIYCYQRPAKLYSSPVTNLLRRLSSSNNNCDTARALDIESENRSDKEYLCLTPNDRLARSPRFSPPLRNGVSKLIYLCNTPGFDTHDGCMELHSLDWDINKGTVLLNSRRVLVMEVKLPTDSDESPAKVGGISFPGLFVNQLPNDCFTGDGKAVYMTTQWGSIVRAIRVSTENGDVKPLRFLLSSKNQASASQNIFSITKHGALVGESEPGQPATVGYTSADALDGEGGDIKCISLNKILWILGAASETSSAVKANSLSFQVLNMSPSHGKVAAPVQTILLLPDNPSNEKIPLIVVPHGGPHSCTSTSYIPSYSYLCQHGKYAILHVNYRGSSGFGQSALESLAGTAGSLDVKDVLHAAEAALELYSSTIDPGRVGICGGSHGGYLAAHCIGQFPDFFKAAAMRNPVTNIATMTSATDIADWCYIESLGPGSYDWNSFRGPTKDELGIMFDASPIAHVDHVKAPTLVALGMSDRRVPPSQGVEYYHTLRSKGIITKLLVYEKDDHAIDRVASEADHWINIKRWFDEYL